MCRARPARRLCTHVWYYVFNHAFGKLSSAFVCRWYCATMRMHALQCIVPSCHCHALQKESMYGLWHEAPSETPAVNGAAPSAPASDTGATSPPASGAAHKTAGRPTSPAAGSERTSSAATAADGRVGSSEDEPDSEAATMRDAMLQTLARDHCCAGGASGCLADSPRVGARCGTCACACAQCARARALEHYWRDKLPVLPAAGRLRCVFFRDADGGIVANTDKWCAPLHCSCRQHELGRIFR